MRVAFLDRRRLPRHKTCGGGVPASVARWLPDLDPAGFVECCITNVRITWQLGDAVEAPINGPGRGSDPALWMVQRAAFDHALAQRAVGFGAELLDGLRVREVGEDRESVWVSAAPDAGGAPWVARGAHLIGADGARLICGESLFSEVTRHALRRFRSALRREARRQPAS